MRNRIIFFIALTLCGILILTAYTIYKENSAHPSYTPKAASSTSKNTNPDYIMKGYGLILFNPDTNKNDSNIINLGESKNFNHNIRFVNNSDKDSTFVLLVYSDYKQISYYLEGNDNLHNTYRFGLKAGQEKIIPVRFPLNFSKNNVTFSIIAGADKHAADIKKVTNLYSISSTFSISTLKSNKLTPEQKPELLDYSNTDGFYGILLNNHPLNDALKGKFFLPPKELKVNRGKRFDLSLIAGGENGVETYLAWVTIDWKQVRSNNGKKTLFFKVPKSSFAYKKINLVAPPKKGRYEVCAFLATNPWVDSKEGILARRINSSFRFTLTVK